MWSFSWKESAPLLSICFFSGPRRQSRPAVARCKAAVGCGGVGNRRHGKTVRTSEGNFLRVRRRFPPMGLPGPLQLLLSCVPTVAGWMGGEKRKEGGGGVIIVVDSSTSVGRPSPSCLHSTTLVSFLFLAPFSSIRTISARDRFAYHLRLAPRGHTKLFHQFSC